MIGIADIVWRNAFTATGRERTALSFGAASRSFGALDRRAMRFANALHGLGVRRAGTTTTR